MNVEALRRERGWSKQTLADASGVSCATIGRLESGYWIRPALLEKITAALASDYRPEPKPQGFAALPPERMREICQQGAAAQAPQRHRWTAESAQEAGRKGGLAISQDREHMRELGRRGGRAKMSKKT